MKKSILLTFLTLAFCSFGIAYGQDTICLTDREYNDLLIRTNCTDIIKADSTVIWDKDNTIALQKEYINGQKEVIKISDSQLKKSKRQTLKYKLGMFGSLVLGVVSNIYLIFR